MSSEFRVGDHVRWNSEAGMIKGVVRKVHKHNTQWRGRTRHCSPEAPQYEVQSDKTGYMAMHKGTALTRIH